jgi:nicotinate-nucleotide pyrophosphorylase
MDSHFGTYTLAIEQVVGLLERIKAAANAEQLSEVEVEHFDQVRNALKSLVPGEPSRGVRVGLAGVLLA